MILRYRPGLSFSAYLDALFRKGVPEPPEYMNGFPLWYASASDALLDGILRSGRSGEVVLPAYTCDRVVRAVLGAGCEPVFCEVDNQGRINRAEIEAAVDSNTIAIVATHMFGAPPDRNGLRELCDRNKMLFIEDCAMASYEQIVDSMASPLPDLCVYSFGKGKPIGLGFGGLGLDKRGCADEGSAGKSSIPGDIVSYFAGISAIARYVSVYWRMKVYIESLVKLMTDYKPRQAPEFSGLVPKRLPVELQAALAGMVYDALGTVNVTKLRGLIKSYRNGLQGMENPWSVALEEQTALFYPLLVENRDSLYKALLAKGINVACFYTYSAGSEYAEDFYPISEKIASQILLLPVHDGLNNASIERICEIILKWRRGQEGVSA